MPYRPKHHSNPRRNPRRDIKFKNRWPWIDWITDEANPRVIHHPGDIIHGARADYRVTARGNFVRINAAPIVAPFARAVAAKGAA